MSEKIVLENVRLSFEHIFKPDAIGESEPKYSASWIIPKNDPQAKKVMEALAKALDEKFPGKRKPGGAWPSNFHNPLVDGDELADERPEYAGCYVLKSASKNRPKVYDRRKNPITAEDEIIYSGCFCNVSLAAQGFEFEKLKKGVTVYLNGVQFFANGERLSGYDASGDFDDLGDDEAGDDFGGLL